jgi:hypothetical protein
MIGGVLSDLVGILILGGVLIIQKRSSVTEDRKIIHRRERADDN